MITLNTFILSTSAFPSLAQLQVLSPFCRSSCLCLSRKSLSEWGLCPHQQGRSRAAPVCHVSRYLACWEEGCRGRNSYKVTAVPQSHLRYLGPISGLRLLLLMCPFPWWDYSSALNTVHSLSCPCLPLFPYVPYASSYSLKYCPRFTDDPKPRRNHLVRIFDLSPSANPFSKPHPTRPEDPLGLNAILDQVRVFWALLALSFWLLATVLRDQPDSFCN